MKIKVTDNQIFVTSKSEGEKIFNYGSVHIDEVGFQAVDNLVDAVIKNVGVDEDVFIEARESDIAAKMIARKIEDKIKRSVTLVLN